MAKEYRPKCVTRWNLAARSEWACEGCGKGYANWAAASKSVPMKQGQELASWCGCQLRKSARLRRPQGPPDRIESESRKGSRDLMFSPPVTNRKSSSEHVERSDHQDDLTLTQNG